MNTISVSHLRLYTQEVSDKFTYATCKDYQHLNYDNSIVKWRAQSQLIINSDILSSNHHIYKNYSKPTLYV